MSFVESESINLEVLEQQFKGEIYTDKTSRLIYSTDASAYREEPLAVLRPKDEEDIKSIIRFASERKLSIIPRAAGTSLAGQVVGSGLVVDISKHMNQVLEINAEEKWVRVQPGVILDELNMVLKPYGLFFGPETSTANRCMIGGMVGNNACGAHSLVYGSTRDHTLELKCILSDGSTVVFGNTNPKEFEQKKNQTDLEGSIYQQIHDILNNDENAQEIVQNYPDPELERRNTGYALDLLLDSEIFKEPSRIPFNFCKLVAGSEGTLGFITEIKLNLVDLPPKNKALVCVHCNSLEDSFNANLIALKHKPVAIELMDHHVLERTRDNFAQKKNRFFVEGNPKAILIVEFAEDDISQIEIKAKLLEQDIREAKLGYHFPIVTGSDISKVWNLRKAGLGLLSNIPGDAKPVAVIEDTAVAPKYLPEYLSDIAKMLESYGKSCVYYAHIATGELHLRPVLNLKDADEVDLFYKIAHDTAVLVKKYRGSISGEHGDGRLRGAFIPLMYGDKITSLFKEIKNLWDPDRIFNPGKIVDTPAMNTSLRYEAGKPTRELETYFDFSKTQGMMRAVEQCNGSGDCRRTEMSGGTMCPSYMATKEESASTRARANLLREMLTNSPKENPFDHQELYDILDLCLSCKACKSECPSNVDMAKFKAEFLQHYYEANGISIRSRLIAYFPSINRITSIAPWIYNVFANSKLLTKVINRMTGFAPQRSLPTLSRVSLRRWMRSHQEENSINGNRKVFLFVDEFTNYNDAGIGIKAVQLLRKLGYQVIIERHQVSGRTYLSKGFVKKAKSIANANVGTFYPKVSEKIPLIGIEPSGILSFRDEYPELVDSELKDHAEKLALHCYTIEEFLSNEIQKRPDLVSLFTDKEQKVKFHAHCYQKALSSTSSIYNVLNIPSNYQVEEIKSGCCGMAGSFGYEKEHYDVSMQVGELVLFPEVRKNHEDHIIAASGTSCRHQIKDGTKVNSFHPVEILYNALK